MRDKPLIEKLRDPKRVVSNLYNRFFLEKISFIRKKGIAPLPKGIILLPTLNCNLNCSMCYIDKYSDINKELKPRDYENLIAELNRWWVKPYFYFLGGEPLVYRYFNELIDVMVKNKYGMVINTNGLLLSKFADKLVNDYVTTIDVSIDGREKQHDEIRGHKNLFQTAISGINEINEIKKRKKSTYPDIDIAVVILPQNYRELYEFLEDMNRIPIRSVAINHLSFLTREQHEAQRKFIDEKFGPSHYFFPVLGMQDIEKSGIDKNILAQQVEKIERNRDKFNFQIRWSREYEPETVINYYTKELSDNINTMSSHCYAIYNTMTIDPYGDMYLCHNYKFGNIKEQSIKEVWNNDKARALRKRHLETPHGFPACRYCSSFCLRTCQICT